MPMFIGAFGHQLLFAMLALYALLGTASLSVAIATRTLPSSELRLQVNAWWLIFPIVTLSLALYPLGPAFLVLMIGILALRDLSLHDAHSPARFRLLCLLLLAVTIVLSAFLPVETMLGYPVLILMQSMLFRAKKRTHDLAFLMFLVLCYGTGFIIQFLRLPFGPQVNSAWLFYLFAVTSLNDIGQFVFGKSFGRHKIAQRISPNKTWEGLGGGIFVSMLVSLMLGTYLELDGTMHLAVYALLMSLGGFAGDLLFSAAKRYFGIKDFSRLIPGHGGILDRVDSLVVTAPLLFGAISLLLLH